MSLPVTPQALITLLTQGAALAGADSPAFQAVGEGLKQFLDDREHAKLEAVLASARSERKAAHDEAQSKL